jgi:bis(5'-adenosyl)-triphosphatase
MSAQVLTDDPGCPFCPKNAAGYRFMESDHFGAIYNISPILPGHSLIIPHKHITGLGGISDSLLSEMIIFARKVTNLLKFHFSCDSFDWTLQDGIPAGQTVPHLHLHIIPRKAGDLPQGTEWYEQIPANEKFIIENQKRERLDENAYSRICGELRQAALAFTQTT